MDGRSEKTSKVLSILLCVFLVANATKVFASDYFSKNITQTNHIIELNPNFVDNGSKIIFMELVGEPETAQPWDYRLVMGDCNGYNLISLTEPGVIDYSILPDGNHVLYLTVNSEVTNDDIDEYNFYYNIKDWELWQLGLKNNSKRLLEKANGRMLKDGYELIGYSGLRDFNKTEYLSQSPKKTQNILVKLEQTNSEFMINFYKVVNSRKQEMLFSSPSSKSASHIDWLPQIVWLTENTFFSVELNDKRSDGKLFRDEEFSIIKFDLETRTKKTLYVTNSEKPISRLKVNEFGTVLYFQKVNPDNLNEIWRMNLTTGLSEKIYENEGGLGEVRNSFDDSSVLFSQVSKNNFDIIRVDLERNKIQRLAGN